MICLALAACMLTACGDDDIYRDPGNGTTLGGKGTTATTPTVNDDNGSYSADPDGDVNQTTDNNGVIDDIGDGIDQGMDDLGQGIEDVGDDIGEGIKDVADGAEDMMNGDNSDANRANANNNANGNNANGNNANGNNTNGNGSGNSSH